MTNYSSIRTTYRIQVITQCYCNSSKFPHVFSNDSCPLPSSHQPQFHRPKRGVAHDLEDFLDHFDEFIQQSIDYLPIDPLIDKYKKLKKSLHDM